MTRILIDRYLTLRQVAIAIGVSARWLYMHRPRLAAEHGFPAPAPGMGKRWAEAEIVAWQRRGLSPAALAATPAEAEDDASAGEWAQWLDRRAADLGEERDDAAD